VKTVYVLQFGKCGNGPRRGLDGDPFFASRAKAARYLREMGYKREKPRNSYELWTAWDGEFWARIIKLKFFDIDRKTVHNETRRD
jgi:hypothetical protein